jgi:hypothetical protein
MRNLKLNLLLKRCPKCNTETLPIFLEEIGGRLHGWFCIQCQFFDKAIGRERRFTKEHANDGG